MTQNSKTPLEAVQFQFEGAWHAVKPHTDRTFCGLNAITAARMWHRWDEQTFRCKRCQSGAGVGA